MIPYFYIYKNGWVVGYRYNDDDAVATAKNDTSVIRVERVAGRTETIWVKELGRASQ